MRQLLTSLFLFTCNFCFAQLNIPCNNWLQLPSYNSFVNVGDLDISGNQVTVEAIFSRTTPYSGGYLWAGDLVSKHTGPSDVNYLLRPNNAEITTSNGYFCTPPACNIQLNKVYHAAMVYDGVTLKFYRNGYLISSVPASGNLFQNNLNTHIGYYDANTYNTNFIGYINEVRIWNTVRSQAQIRSYMNTSLPNPTTQTGLLAYYTFDNLLNKQGNTTFNGTLGGSAISNSTLPTCNYVIDSCEQIALPVDSTIINKYTPVLNYDICLNQLIVEDASEFKVGDTVLLFQMKGAAIDSSNTSSFGNVTDYKSAGNYEYNYIRAINGNVIDLKNTLLRTYEIPQGVVQLIRVPYYSSYSNTQVLTCLPWDGKKGGILALNVQNNFSMGQNIDVSGRGFRGGVAINSQLNSWQPGCESNNYFYPSNGNASQGKGEGIAQLSSAKMSGRGKLANGGGGGNLVNAGGGGGSNGTAGGQGGNQFEGCGNNPFANGGSPGLALSYTNAVNKLFLGGGGGAGDANDPLGGNAFNPNGGNGGGIILISAETITSNGFQIIANGNDGKACTTNCNEGMGGGGAGGTVFISANQFVSALTVTAIGGKGANNTSVLVSSLLKNHGPGAGGSGGIVLLKQATKPTNVIINNNGGANGIITNNSNFAFGAQTGTQGLTQYNYFLPISTAPFKKNIDSVRINFSNPVCNSYMFSGLGFTNSLPVNSWQWFFGNAGMAATQNASYTFNNQGSYDVKLIAKDINGCKDSITIAITAIATPQQPVATLLQPTCTIATGSITINSPLGNNFEYSINSTNFQNSPVFTAVAPGAYNVIVRNKSNGCLSPISSVSIDPATNSAPVPKALVTDQPDCIIPTGTITINSPLGAFYDYSIDGVQFQSGTVFNSLSPGSYSVTVRNNLTGCLATSTVLSVDPVPANPAIPVIGAISQPGCTVKTGSFTIVSPLGADLLYSLNGNNPQASGNFVGLTPGTYSVTTNNSSNGCISSRINVIINQQPVIPTIATASVTEQPNCTISSGTITITAPIGNNYEYSVDGVSFQSSFLFRNLSPNNYNVIVRDKNSGCSSQPLQLIVKPDVAATGNYFMANAFSPNGDGLNDCFGVKNWGVITEFQFMIFNIWGELVFSTTNPIACWDGTFKERQSPLGNYVYYIKANTLCGKVERKGNLALIR
ncbi:T9SS type B sorting domain-containing protein [Lacibacter luteus]|uniref:T9SS type B sorting domain-containing protein n=1 Tax=Lacibacter luteus TaxID=2508719 RepID=A0A4Q1CNC8_9BACT|nr:gliding motility-associated C-terminal domain-containing protein [Lacibacter luteus]RXK62235.1 T9SS type B sorting domain-containing protein [Lacibacter luteus]